MHNFTQLNSENNETNNSSVNDQLDGSSSEEKEIDLTQCAREPIHILGSIQPHGLLFALQEPELIITQVSENVAKYFGQAATSLISKNLSNVLGEITTLKISSKLVNGSLENINPLPCKMKLFTGEIVAFDLIMHRSEGLLILEMEPHLDPQQNYADGFLEQVKQITTKIQCINNLVELCQIIVTEIKSLTGFDRVMVYQFNENADGCVIAEARESSVISYMGLNFPASDIPPQARMLYLRNWFRIISDVDASPLLLVNELNSLTNKKLDLSFSVLRSVSPMHIQYLNNMGVKASMSISLIVNKQLWGLIACHHSTAKFLTYKLRRACEFLGQVVSAEIAQILINTIQEERILRNNDFHQLLNAMTQSDNWMSCIVGENQSEFLNIFKASGVALYDRGEYHLIGLTPTLEVIKDLISHLVPLMHNGVYATNHLTTVYPAADSIRDTASGVMIQSVNNEFIIWFRQELIHDLKWAGDPNEPALIELLKKQICPRRSFAVWTQNVRGQSALWSDIDLRVCNEFKEYLLAIAINYQMLRVKSAQLLAKSRGEFAATMCHEMRTPINGFLGSLGLARDQAKEMRDEILNHPNTQLTTFLLEHLEAMEENFADIETCGKHQMTVATDVLDLFKLEANKLELESIPMCFNTIIQSAINMVRSSFIAKNIELHFFAQEDKVLARGDPNRLRQIIVNMLTNAVKFTHQGSVKVSLTQVEIESNPRVQIDIEDTGIGMSPDELTRIFTPYSQANAGISGKFGGTGLGMNISQKFVDLMHGTIKVTSVKGEGSKFSVFLPYIPLTDEDEFEFEFYSNQKNALINKKKRLSQRDQFIPPTLAPQTILLAEDNTINQKIFCKMVLKMGHTCLIANNGSEAVTLFSENRIDIIFMDIHMPEMDGIEATGKIREIEQSENLKLTPIIGLSADARKESGEFAIKTGMNTFLSKPFNEDEIAALINQWGKVRATASSEKRESTSSISSLYSTFMTRELRHSRSVRFFSEEENKGELIRPVDATTLSDDEKTIIHDKLNNFFKITERAKNKTVWMFSDNSPCFVELRCLLIPVAGQKYFTKKLTSIGLKLEVDFIYIKQPNSENSMLRILDVNNLNLLAIIEEPTQIWRSQQLRQNN